MEKAGVVTKNLEGHLEEAHTLTPLLTNVLALTL